MFIISKKLVLLLVLNSDKSEVNCRATTQRRQSLSSRPSIQVADASVSLGDHIQLLGITLDNRLSFDKHVPNVCSISYFHIRALRHFRTFIDLESSKSNACAIDSSRFDNANSCLSGVNSSDIHRLQWVQNNPCRQTNPATVSRSLLASLHWLPICPRVTFNIAGRVYRIACKALHETYSAELSSLLHMYAQHDHFNSLPPTF